MNLGGGESPTLPPLEGVGTGMRHEKQKARLSEIIAKVNDLFQGELTDDDKLVYVNNVIKGKLLESVKLQQQAANNTKEQFATSPDLHSELVSAIISALDAHTTMSSQALNSASIQNGLKDILLNHARLWEALRERASTGHSQEQA